MNILDCRAQKCPHPVVETRKRLLAQPGTPLRVLVGDDIARENIFRLASSQGYDVKVSAADGGFALELTPGKKAPEGKAAQLGPEGKTVVFITGDTMGTGNDDLGRLLLKNFLFTMAETETAPDLLLFVNAGVKLAAQESEALEALKKLACMGTDIASCGLCLDFYHLKEKLAAGRSTNMLEILQSLQNAGRVIRP